MASLWNSYTATERKNISFYIGGIMLYKLGLEAFNGSIVTLATDRFTAEGTTFTKLSMLTGLNQAMQVVGSILIAPLIKRFPTRSVLSSAVLIFGLTTVLFLAIDAGTGGLPRTRSKGHKVHYGSWNPNALFPLYCLSGIAYGMVELIRRVIPRDIVGGDVHKLRKMDALVHILYEVAGTFGALLSVTLIKTFGNNFAFCITPGLFALASVLWYFVDRLGHEKDNSLQAIEKESLAHGMLNGAKAFGKSTYRGAQICFSDRKFIWLLPGYSVALYGHRYLENALAPAIAKRIMKDSSYSQIMVTGSNFGELMGAATVLFFTKYIKTPLPFLRFDALALLIVWVLPTYTKQIVPNKNAYAWKIAGMLIPVSMGWAAGDVSLAAFIQASLARVESKDREISALGAVMAFLYSSYIIIYAVLGSLLGKYIDHVWTKDKSIYRALNMIGGVQFTVISVVVLSASLIPRGAFAINPEIINDTSLEGEVERDGTEVESTDIDKDDKKYHKEDELEIEPEFKKTDVGATF